MVSTSAMNFASKLCLRLRLRLTIPMCISGKDLSDACSVSLRRVSVYDLANKSVGNGTLISVKGVATDISDLVQFERKV